MTADRDDLIPCVVQDRLTGSVLMVAWVNDEAMAATQRTGEAHFWSRSRDELWHKGATSGNTMRVISVSLDCDDDTVLLEVLPAGPACHTGTATCFDEPPRPGGRVLDLLWDRIVARSGTDDRSYTRRLIDGGVAATTAKISEEASELVEAIEQHGSGSADPNRVAEEAADLMYHTLVSLRERGVDAALVFQELARRGSFDQTRE